jgi:S1-C subfamily serine protease
MDQPFALSQLSDSLVKLVEAVSPAVVGVSHPRGTGSGVILAPDGYVLTNYHVIHGAPSVEVSLAGGEVLRGEVLGGDPKTDLAVIRAHAAARLPYLRLIDGREVRVGQIVLAVGNPFRFERSVSWGLVSAIDRTLGSPQGPLEGLIQTDAAINPGNSGGPLVSVEGAVVGINTAIVPFAQGLGFAVPAYTASWVAGELIRTGKVKRRFLGIAASGIELGPPLTRREKILRAVHVHRVEPGSPAADGGLEQGDLLTRAESRELWNLDDLQRVLSVGESRTIEFELFRGNSLLKRSVRPVEIGSEAQAG